jgi:hypothetical protein
LKTKELFSTGTGRRLKGYNDMVIIDQHMQQQKDEFEAQSLRVGGEER